MAQTSQPPKLSLQRPQLPDLTDAITKYQKSPIPEHADNLLLAASPTISRALKAYGGVDTPALRAQAKLLTLDAAKTYTPKEAKPETHLLSQLQALRRISASAANIGYMPEQVRLDAPKIQRHAMELQQELGRDPSDAELADHIGIPIERIARARKGTAAFTSSSLPEGVETTLPSYEKENRNNWAKYVYHDLTPAGQIVMEHTLGLNGKPLLSTEEIARKANISTGRVSQYRADIEKSLNSYVKFVS